MFPILYSSDATDFSGNGVGILRDVITCSVTEELNTSFELVMQYPVVGVHYSDIHEACWVKAKPNPYCETPQLFRVYKISKPISGVVTIWAEHTTYAVDRYVCFPNTDYEDTEGSVDTMIAHLNSSIQGNVPGFTFVSELTNNSVYKWSVPTPTAIKSVRNRMASTWGGDWVFTNNAITLLDRRGSDRGVSVSYGENIQTATMEWDTSGQYTCVCAFWKGADPNAGDGAQTIVYTDPVFKPLYANTSVNDLYFKPCILDCSSKFSEKPQPSDLDECIHEFVRANLDIGNSANRCSVKVVPRGSTVEYAHLTDVDHIELGDTISINLGHGESAVTQRCIKTVFDVAHERYTSIDLGTKKRSVSSVAATSKVDAGMDMVATSKADVASITAKKNADDDIVNITITYTDDTTASFACSYDAEKQLTNFGAVPIKYE
jgi:phage minor structural protein